MFKCKTKGGTDLTEKLKIRILMSLRPTSYECAQPFQLKSDEKMKIRMINENKLGTKIQIDECQYIIINIISKNASYSLSSFLTK